MIQVIENDSGLHLASIVDCTTYKGFITEEDEPLQISVQQFTIGQMIDYHSHRDIAKYTNKTIEAWVVLSGEIEVIISDGEGFDRRIVVGANNIVIRFAGFHSLKTKTEDYIMVEFRNGPYLGKNMEIVSI